MIIHRRPVALALAGLLAMASGLTPLAAQPAQPCGTPKDVQAEWRALDSELQRLGYSVKQRQSLLATARKEMAGIFAGQQPRGSSACSPNQSTAMVLGCTRSVLPGTLSSGPANLDEPKPWRDDKRFKPPWNAKTYTVREFLFIGMYSTCLSNAIKLM
ncbi:hypothetical protein [Bosea sp. RAC05]|jgi:hypothetical protein|uniref:hypothetical protein n=1 Tax=Bosea sp. RAC05 TaxID=1842539 RepID=UPI00083D6052|nr:hypothetical protein [Bosea sp. RAC05]AOG03708.1 hypothetical protein BSY19_3445 [Bosea sp. RAC05]